MELPPAERTEGDIDHVDHLVGTSRFFSRLEESQRRELYRVATYEACAAGGWLFRQGDVGSFSRELAVHPCRVDAAHIVRWGTGNAFYIILVGQVDVIVSLVPEAGARGRVRHSRRYAAVLHAHVTLPPASHMRTRSQSTRFDKHVATLGPLESFGEKALEDSDSLRKASIRAREAVELMRVDREGYTRVTANWRQRTAPHKIAFLRGTGFFPGWSDDQLFALAGAWRLACRPMG